MDTVTISQFKARCLAILARVKRTGQPVLVTRFGEPVAEVVPPSGRGRRKSWLGSMEGTGRIMGDIVTATSDPCEWEINHR